MAYQNSLSNLTGYDMPDIVALSVSLCTVLHTVIVDSMEELYRMGKNKHYQVLPIRKKPYQLKMTPVESPWNFGP